MKYLHNKHVAVLYVLNEVKINILNELQRLNKAYIGILKGSNKVEVIYNETCFTVTAERDFLNTGHKCVSFITMYPCVLSFCACSV